MRPAALLLLVLAAAAAIAASTEPKAPAETVMLIHGHGRTARSLERLGERLEDAGFAVVYFEYESRKKPFDSLVEDLDRAVEACCADRRQQLNFVTHSLGGILVRGYLDGHASRYEGRVVMLSPPNHGSEVVDAFGDWPLFRGWLGPTGRGLGTAPDAIPESLGPAEFDLGIIMGTRSIAPIGSLLIPGDDDGRVSVENAALEGSLDFLTVPRTHTFIMNSPEVARQCAHFLRNGAFTRAAQASASDPG